MSNAHPFAPDSFGCHEALQMASFLASAVDAELCQHEAVKRDPNWRRLADTAATALADLYQAIGAEHAKAQSQVID